MFFAEAITNLVIGWTSLQTQAALTAFKSSGLVFAPEVIRHISPIRYANINFRGTFKFPIEYGYPILNVLAIFTVNFTEQRDPSVQSCRVIEVSVSCSDQVSPKNSFPADSNQVE